MTLGCQGEVENCRSLLRLGNTRSNSCRTGGILWPIRCSAPWASPWTTSMKRITGLQLGLIPDRPDCVGKHSPGQRNSASRPIVSLVAAYVPAGWQHASIQRWRCEPAEQLSRLQVATFRGVNMRTLTAVEDLGLLPLPRERRHAATDDRLLLDRPLRYASASPVTTTVMGLRPAAV